MKKFISIILVLVLITSVGSVAYATYETEETPVALIQALIDEGFQRDPDDANIWKYSEKNSPSDEFYVIIGRFDTDLNIGVAFGYGYDENGEEQFVAGVCRWDNIAGDFETLVEFES